MEKLNDHIKRMVSLIDSKHGNIKPLVNEDDKKMDLLSFLKSKDDEPKKTEPKKTVVKSDEPKKELPKKELPKKELPKKELPKKVETKKEDSKQIDLINELDKLCDYDYRKAEDLVDFIEDNFPQYKINDLNEKILNLIKTCDI